MNGTEVAVSASRLQVIWARPLSPHGFVFSRQYFDGLQDTFGATDPYLGCLLAPTFAATGALGGWSVHVRKDGWIEATSPWGLTCNQRYEEGGRFPTRLNASLNAGDPVHLERVRTVEGGEPFVPRKAPTPVNISGLTALLKESIAGANVYYPANPMIGIFNISGAVRSLDHQPGFIQWASGRDVVLFDAHWYGELAHPARAVGGVALFDLSFIEFEGNRSVGKSFVVTVQELNQPGTNDNRFIASVQGKEYNDRLSNLDVTMRLVSVGFAVRESHELFPERLVPHVISFVRHYVPDHRAAGWDWIVGYGCAGEGNVGGLAFVEAETGVARYVKRQSSANPDVCQTGPLPPL